ncbi:MAG: YggS family pyridoxal phosphate-dependent enzyme [Chitinophagaceae bacterium]
MTYAALAAQLTEQEVELVAVSKIQPAAAILALYGQGQRDFGENYVQELVDKQSQLPGDIRWHFIGHLQTNKVKYIAPFVHLVHGADSYKLIKEIDKQGRKHNRVIGCLLQVHIAQEETKFGLDENELDEIVGRLTAAPLEHVRVAGLMGMASFSDDQDKVRNEFRRLKRLFDKYAGIQSAGVRFEHLSMGMSADYTMAIEEGSTMVRIGSLLFGQRK